MDLYLIIGEIALAIGFSANVAIAGVSLLGYSELKLKPLLLVGLSAILGAVCIVFPVIFLRGEEIFENTGYSVWILLSILGILDFLLYASGICLLVKYLLKRDEEGNA